MVDLHPIALPLPGFEQLQADAHHEGFLFIDRLWSEWEDGRNRFNAPGETLIGCTDQGLLVAVGGLNRNPFDGPDSIGRIRRVYVRPAWRNQGVGQALLHALIASARSAFTTLHLRTDNPAAARLYERIGFAPSALPNATHILHLAD